MVVAFTAYDGRGSTPLVEEEPAPYTPPKLGRFCWFPVETMSSLTAAIGMRKGVVAESVAANISLAPTAIRAMWPELGNGSFQIRNQSG